MNHLPYIIAAYVIAVGVPLLLSAEALFRVQAAYRRLQAIGPRRNRSQG